MKKYVIYTAISGGVDILRSPSYLDKQQFDYVCFKDKWMPPWSMSWDLRNMHDSNLDNVRKAKEYKCLPHRFFSEHEWSIWIDGNVDIVGDLTEIIQMFEKESIVCVPHPERNCAYAEAEVCAKLLKDDPKIIRKQMDHYRKDGFPRNMGLVEANVIFRRHNDPVVIRLMEDWWKEINQYSRRDQLSFNYVIWKNKYRYSLLGKKSSLAVDDYIRYRNHLKDTLRNRLWLYKSEMLGNSTSARCNK